jgi:hypothetical protein
MVDVGTFPEKKGENNAICAHGYNIRKIRASYLKISP